MLWGTRTAKIYQYAETVATKTLFKRKRDGVDDKDEDGNDNSTAVSSLFSNGEPDKPILESIMSMQAVQTTILIVSF